MQAIHAMRGGKFRGWFAREPESPRETNVKSTAESWPFVRFITRQQWDALDQEQRLAVEWEAFKALQAVQAAMPAAPSGKQRRTG